MSNTKKDNVVKKNDQDVNLEEMLEEVKKESKIKDEKEEKGINRDKELEKYKDQAMRAIAELQNAKRRMEQEKTSFIKYSSANLLTSLLSVVDNFERAFYSLPKEIEENEWIKGVTQIEKTFINILLKEGLEKFEPKSWDEFNPNLHEGVMQDINIEEWKISQCLEKWYILKDKVLRVAKVSVWSK